MTGDYHSQPRPEVVALVPDAAARILDVGCGDGTVGAALRRPDRRVHGIEGLASAAAVAADRLDGVDHLDLNDADGLQAVLDRAGPFDCIIVADVLEHLVDPWSALDTLVAALEPEGTVVLSLPNLRVLSTTLPLVLQGRFDYVDRGVRDRTHLRFFTRASIIELVEGAGLLIVSLERAPAPWRRGVRAIVGRLLGDLGNEQFLVLARRQ